jgi:hypothetical protein
MPATRVLLQRPGSLEDGSETFEPLRLMARLSPLLALYAKDNDLPGYTRMEISPMLLLKSGLLAWSNSKLQLMWPIQVRYPRSQSRKMHWRCGQW